MPEDFQEMFKAASTGKSGKTRKKTPLKFSTHSDTDYVEIKKSDKKPLSSISFGSLSIGYDYESQYKDLEVTNEEDGETRLTFFVKHSPGGYLKCNLNQQNISKFWFNTEKRLFGLYYDKPIPGIPTEFVSGSGVCFKPQSRFKHQLIDKAFHMFGNIDAEKTAETDIGCNIPGEKQSFNPSTFLTKTIKENSTPKKPRKVIRNESSDEHELSPDEEEPKRPAFKSRKIEIEPQDSSPEKSPEEKPKTQKSEKKELSEDESDNADISDSEIVKKRHITRSSTKSRRETKDLDKVVLRKYNIDITVRDVSRLDPDEFLNDNIIDFYLRHLEEQFKGPKSKQVKNDFYIFNTHFYQLLKKDSSRAAERIAKNVALFQKKFIFIPVNENVHWSLIVICNPNGTTVKIDKKDPSKKYGPDSRMLMYCDSLGGAIPINTTKRVREFLSKRYLVEHPESNGKSFTAENFPVGKANLPKQDNHVDCGVFMIHYIQLLVGADIEVLPIDDPELFLTSDIPTKRSNIKTDIEYEIQQNPALTQSMEQSFNSQSDSVLAMSQLEDSIMKEAAIENNEENTENKEEKQTDQPETNKAESGTQDSEDLFTEKVLERDSE